MSSGIPILYAQPESLSVPYSVLGDDLKSFKGAKSSVRSVPTSSGTAGPSSTILFNLPVGANSFIKSNSMYIRGTCVVSQTGAATNLYGFAGQGADATTESQNFGGASSMISRISVNMGGTSVTYGSYNTFRNAVLPHVCSAEYFTTDLKQCEHAGVWRDNTNADAGLSLTSRTIHFAIPLWLPPFCSSQHFPALLMSSPIAIEILTESVGKAFYSEGANAVTDYALSNLSLVYETIDVSREFKDAMLASKAGGFYSMHMNDYLAVGPNSATASMRMQIGVGCSSLKSILFTETASNPAVTDRKVYTSNGLINYTIHADNYPVSVANAGDNEAVCFLEVNRALQKINDSNVTSAIYPVANANASAVRTSYATNNFLGGASTQTISDYNYSSSGIECSSVVLELEHGSPDNAKWGSAPDFSANNSVVVFLLHDSILSVNVSDGTVQVRK
jgi:hypothetical protein